MERVYHGIGGDILEGDIVGKMVMVSSTNRPG